MKRIKFAQSTSASRDILSPGKLSPKFLGQLISSLPQDKRVIVGPMVGGDAAVIDFGKTCLVVKTDPITFTKENLGWYVVNINANDIACMGAVPRWFLATLLLSQKGASKGLVKKIFKQVSSACQELGVSLVGGHTEVTPGLNRAIIVGQMIGEVAREKLVGSSGAKVGDVVLLTKGVAIEGTHVIYQEKGEELKKRVSIKILNKMKDLIHEPGISVVKEALLASGSVKVHSMHDPTEGGLRVGLWELASASGVGMRIEKEKIPILKETEAVCELYGLDPLGLLASGALILSMDLKEAEKLCPIYKKEGIECSVIGKVVPREKEVRLIDRGKEVVLSEIYQDELNKIL